MDELLVAVLLRHHRLTAPDHLMELLLYAMQRQTAELTAQRSCGSFYRRSPSLSPAFCVVFIMFVMYSWDGCWMPLHVGSHGMNVCIWWRCVQTISAEAEIEVRVLAAP